MTVAGVSPTQPSPRVSWKRLLLSAWTFSALAAVLTAAALGISLRQGIGLSPDGWAYWQGSVSLLEGKGYRYFFGPSIRDWPPLYPLYLAVWQHFLGVSGRTLVVSNIALAAVAAFNWTAIFLLPVQALAQDRRRLVLPSLLVLVFVAGTLTASYRAVLAHNLVYAILPLALFGAHHLVVAGKQVGRFTGLALATGLLLTLLLLSHNSSACYVAPFATLAVSCRSQRRWVRLLAVLLLAVLPVSIWLTVRLYLGQLNSHPLGWGVANYTFPEYLRQLLTELAYLLGPAQGGIGYVLLGGLALSIALGCCRSAPGNCGVRAALATYLLLALGSALCLLGLFNLIWINDPLGRRFILFLPLTLFPSAVFLTWPMRTFSQEGTSQETIAAAKPAGGFLGSLRKYPPAMVLAGVVLVALYRYGYWVSCAGQPREFDLAHWQDEKGFAYNNLTISPAFIHRPPLASGDYLLVSPPYEPWIEKRVHDEGGSN